MEQKNKIIMEKRLFNKNFIFSEKARGLRRGYILQIKSVLPRQKKKKPAFICLNSLPFSGTTLNLIMSQNRVKKACVSIKALSESSESSENPIFPFEPSQNPIVSLEPSENNLFSPEETKVEKDSLDLTRIKNLIILMDVAAKRAKDQALFYENFAKKRERLNKNAWTLFHAQNEKKEDSLVSKELFNESLSLDNLEKDNSLLEDKEKNDSI